MNRIERAFAHGKAFIPFVTAGDPSLRLALLDANFQRLGCIEGGGWAVPQGQIEAICAAVDAPLDGRADA